MKHKTKYAVTCEYNIRIRKTHIIPAANEEDAKRHIMSGGFTLWVDGQNIEPDYVTSVSETKE